MEEREPVAKENDMTPHIMIIIPITLSKVFLPEISPYPTVVIVVIV